MKVIPLVRNTVKQFVVYLYHRSWRKVKVIPLVRNTVKQIVVYLYHRSWRKVKVIPLVCNTVTDRGVLVPQIMAKSEGDSACA